MDTIRRFELLEAIRRALPHVRVRTEWETCDFPVSGIEISASDARTGCMLCAVLGDDELDKMTDQQVLTWAREQETTHRERGQKALRRRASDREVDNS